MSRTRKKQGKEPRPVDYAVLKQRGREEFQAGRFQQAILLWERCLRDGGAEEVELKAGLGEAHYRAALTKDDPALRAAFLKRAITYRPDMARYRYALGLVSLLQGDALNSLEAFLKAQELDDQAEEARWGEALAWIGTKTSGCLELLKERAKNAEERRSTGARGQESGGEMTSPPLPSTSAPQLPSPSAPQHPCPSAQRWGWLLGLAHLSAGNDGAALDLAKRWEEDPSFSLLAAAGEFLAGKPEGAAGRLERLLSSHQPPATCLRMASSLLGAALLRSGRSAEAAQVWERSLDLGGYEIREALASLSLFLVREALATGRYEEAREVLSKALELRPQDETLQKLLRQVDLTLAQQAAQRGDWEKAAGLWQGLLERGEEVRQNLALALEHLERPEQANVHWQELARVWKKALADSPAAREQRGKLALLHRHLAANYREIGDPSRAAQEYEKALHYEPSDLETRMELADLYLSLGEYGNALPHLKTVLKERADDPRALNALGIAYQLKGKDEEAITCWRKVLAGDPHNPLAREMAGAYHAKRAFSYWDGGEYTKALEELERQIALKPEAFHPHIDRGEIYLEMGRETQAAEAFSQALATNPKDPFIPVDIGRHCLRQKKKKLAKRYFQQALRLRPDARTLSDIGLAYSEEAHDFRQAERYFQQALALGEKEIPLVIGERLQQMASPLAKRYLEEAVRRDPENPRPHLSLGFEYLLSGDFKRAREAFAQTEQLMANLDASKRQALQEGLRLARKLLAAQDLFGPVLGFPGPRFPWRSREG